MAEDNVSWIVQQIEMLASIQKRTALEVWRSMYAGFEHKTDMAFSRIAYNAEPQKKVLTVIREEGYLDQFAEYVDWRLKLAIEEKDGK